MKETMDRNGTTGIKHAPVAASEIERIDLRNGAYITRDTKTTGASGWLLRSSGLVRALEPSEADFVDFALAAHTQQPAAVAAEQVQSKGMIGFIDDVIEIAFEGGDVDGASIQEMAEEHGLLQATEMAEPCRDDERCRCADGNDFPLTCYRKTYKRTTSAHPPAGELPVLPECADELAEADGFNVIGTVEVFAADQMHAFYKQGRVVGREDAVALIERQIATENMDTSGLGARMRIIDAIRALNK